MYRFSGLPRDGRGGTGRKNTAVSCPDCPGSHVMETTSYCENHASLFEGTILRTNFIYHKFFSVEMPAESGTGTGFPLRIPAIPRPLHAMGGNPLDYLTSNPAAVQKPRPQHENLRGSIGLLKRRTSPYLEARQKRLASREAVTLPRQPVATIFRWLLPPTL